MKRIFLPFLAPMAFLGAEPAGVAKWEADVAAIETRVREAAPAPGGTFFIGSSTIRLWKLGTSFPGTQATNVGFGGSQIADCTRFAPRLVLPWKPARVVFYGGGNDVNAGRTPTQVAADFKEFTGLIHAALPKCQIVCLAINPSSSRWKLWDEMQQANRLIETFCQSRGEPQLRFIDFSRIFLGDDGLPRAELYLDDKLHLNDAGYAAWAEKLRPALGLK